MNDNQNFIIAIALSVAILIGWQFLYKAPQKQAAEVQQAEKQQAAEQKQAYAAPRPHDDVVKETQRVAFKNDKITGSINLRGGRVDDLTLTAYRQTIKPDSPNITLLSPAGSAAPFMPFYAEFGWLSAGNAVKVPDASAEWKPEGGTLAPGSDVTLHWDNGAGLVFTRVISLDGNYMFTVTDTVKNTSGHEVTLTPFALVSRHGVPPVSGLGVHEGPLGVFNDTLHERSYKDMREKPPESETSDTGGWAGIGDVYWLANVIAEPKDKITGHFLHGLVGPEEHVQADIQKAPVTIAQGGETTSRFHLFAGAKEMNLLNAYKESTPVPIFDRAIDFGHFLYLPIYFIAEPFFQAVTFIGRHVGNYGLAIIIFTICLRLLFYPMSESSYRNMEQMKALKPQMDKLKERYGNDPAKLNQEVTQLYKTQKLNPLAGCLPVLIQIPIFIALYRVLLVAIEMRHAPFYGWIHDLSAPDPSNVFTLFGLLPWTMPHFLSFIPYPHLGALPLLMGVTMLIQQRLSPPPADKATQQIFLFMPLIFTFLLANMSAGLVVYWIFSNILAIAQQTLIKHRTKSTAVKAA